ncbi:MAG TPA: hypothetical protein VH374_23720 [Polyangia bacterium]|jgi:hypothetical protein|nr:hypothetical protein [Polyangia bacterium]
MSHVHMAILLGIALLLALLIAWFQTRRLSRPDLTLERWREGVSAGWRPTQILNVTIAETGERLLLGAIDCPTHACAQGGASWRGQSMLDLYGAGRRRRACPRRFPGSRRCRGRPTATPAITWPTAVTMTTSASSPPSNG